MKTQFSFRKYGFTLIELMIVISIILFIFYQFSKISFLPKEDIAKAERLANKVANVLHEGLMNTSIGRMDSVKQPSTGAVISFSTSTGISWKFTQVMSGVFAPPFYDGDNLYQIRDITWTGGRGVNYTGTSASLMIIIDNNRSTFTGNLNDTATIVTIRTRYRNMNKKVVFDRRTGRIEVNKD